MKRKNTFLQIIYITCKALWKQMYTDITNKKHIKQTEKKLNESTRQKEKNNEERRWNLNKMST